MKAIIAASRRVLSAVQHAAGHRHAEMRLVHLRDIGRHDRDRVADADADPVERRGELAAARVGHRAELPARAAAALRDVVGAALADELVGVPARAVVARSSRRRAAQRRALEARLRARAAGGAAAPPFELAVAVGVEAVGRHAGLGLHRLVAERIGAPAARHEGVVVGRRRRQAQAIVVGARWRGAGVGRRGSGRRLRAWAAAARSATCGGGFGCSGGLQSAMRFFSSASISDSSTLSMRSRDCSVEKAAFSAGIGSGGGSAAGGAAGPRASPAPAPDRRAASRAAARPPPSSRSIKRQRQQQGAQPRDGRARAAAATGKAAIGGASSTGRRQRAGGAGSGGRGKVAGSSEAAASFS